MAFKTNRKKGFSLIAVAAILAVIAVLIITLLPNDSDKYRAQLMKTSDKIAAIQKAVKVYISQDPYGLPACPARIDQLNDSSHPAFGVSNTTYSDGTPTTNCACPAVTQTPSGIYCPSTNKTALGGVPTKTLGLSDDYAFDEWGNRFTYVISTDPTHVGASLTVKDLSGTFLPGIAALIISHGPDGIGAWQRNPTATPSCALNGTTPATVLSEIQNCSYWTSNPSYIKAFVKDNFHNTPATSPNSDAKFFDDIVGAVYNCPAGILDCNLWVDAYDDASITQSSGAVSLWKDKSGNGNDASTSNGPPNSQAHNMNLRQVLYFGGNGQMNIPNYAGTVNSTIVAMAKQTANTGNGGYERILNGSMSDGVMFFGTNNYNFATFYGNGAWNDVQPNTINESIAWPSILGVTNNNTTAIPYANGNPQNNKGGTTLPYTGLVVGAANGTGAGQNFTGDMAEIVTYPRALTAAELLKIETYLSNKWNPCPAGVFGCTLWLDAADVNNGGTQPNANDPISTWVDKSGLGNNFGQTGLARPTFDTSASALNGKGVKFDGSTQYMKTAPVNYTNFTSNNAISIFLVHKVAAAIQNTVPFIWEAPDNSNRVWLTPFWNDNNAMYFDFGNDSNGRLEKDPTSGHTNSEIMTAIHSSNNSQIFQNGTLLASGTSQNATLNNASYPLYLGTYPTGPQFFYNGDIAEIVIYPRALTDNERQNVECYLIKKWNISAPCAPVIIAELPRDFSSMQSTNGFSYGEMSVNNVSTFTTSYTDSGGTSYPLIYKACGFNSCNQGNNAWENPGSWYYWLPYVSGNYATPNGGLGDPAGTGGWSAAIQYTVPSSLSGTIQISLNNARKSGANNSDPENFLIYKNSTLLGSTSAGNNGVGHNVSVTTTVAPGDKIYLEINQNGNGVDTGYWDSFIISQ